MWSLLCTCPPSSGHPTITTSHRTSTTTPSTPNPAQPQPHPQTAQPLQQLPPPPPPPPSPFIPPINTVNTPMPKQSALRSRMDGPRPPAKQKQPHIDPLDKAGYVLGSTVGVGAYAKVKLATNARTGTKVAVKIVCKRKAPEGYCAKFLPREIKALRRIRHPNVINLFETIDDVDRFYMVMEFAPNGDLLEYINKHGYIYEDEAKKMFRQIVTAVAHCHASGVVHRDLKCENILLDEKMNVKVCDFGFAALVQSPTVTLTTHCGSYAYAAPEILTNKPYVGALSDVWSLGVILYAMTVGRLPFNDSDLPTLMQQIGQRLPTPRRLSSRCTDTIRKILVVNPSKRLRSREILEQPWLCTSKSRGSRESRRGSGNQLPQLHHTSMPQPPPPPPPTRGSSRGGSRQAKSSKPQSSKERHKEGSSNSGGGSSSSSSSGGGSGGGDSSSTSSSAGSGESTSALAAQFEKHRLSGQHHTNTAAPTGGGSLPQLVPAA